MHLLRIPDECIHDPLAFAIGVAPLISVLGITFKLYAASDRGLRGIFSLVMNWFRTFRPSYTSEKVRTLILFFALWLVICPVLLGFFYFRVVIGSSGTFPHRYHLCHFALACWGTGTLLLNLWAIMCYFQIFTKRFWADLIIGDVEGGRNEGPDVEVNEAREGLVNAPAQNAGLRENNAHGTRAVVQNNLAWQGQHGAIALAVESLKAVTLGWEWDKVDKESLLQDCAIPVVKHLAVACAIPITVVAIIESLVNTVGIHIGATPIFRMVAIATVVVDSLISSQQYLRHCFQAAHDIARDDRYLVGEILLNFAPQQLNT